MTAGPLLFRWSAIVFVTALGTAATSCGSDNPEVFVVGDSTMEQVEGIIGRGATAPGCGFTFDAPCLIPLEFDEDPDLIVAAASIWDKDASAAEIEGGYRDYHAQLSAKAPVVWVEMPPLLGGEQGEPTAEEADTFNAEVAAALDCELVEWQIRDGRSDDGIHYVGNGAADVAERFADLSEDQACTPAE